MVVPDKTVDFSSFLNNQSAVAVGVSGGADSMALAHMLGHEAARRGMAIHLLTVDHGLRSGSATEAEAVGRMTAAIPHSRHAILNWTHDNGESPQGAVMERARKARYDLMARYCRDNGIDRLFIAHHADDQAETFFFRLAKGSGLDGLCGMEAVATRDGIQVCRPLLRFTHQDLIDYCIQNDLQWIEDPSNSDQRYARPRLRQALAAEGWDARRMDKTVMRLSRAREALDRYARNALDACRLGDNRLDWERLNGEPTDIVIRVVAMCLEEAGGTAAGYPPKMERLETVVATLRPSKSATLHGCVLTLSRDGKTLEIVRSAP